MGPKRFEKKSNKKKLKKKLRCLSLALSGVSLMVSADIYIFIFSDCIVAFTYTLEINMQIRHFPLTISCLPAPNAKFSLAGCIKVLF